MPVVYVISQSA